MGAYQHTELVRKQVHQTLLRIGGSPDDEFVEKVLIRDGYFCGRKFNLGAVSAVWFVEEAEIKFFGREGQLISVARPSAGFNFSQSRAA